MKQAPPSNRKGGWIGIDLGTSNCTAAVWDLERSRCKVLRLGFKNLARPPPDGNKSGKIVPSATQSTTLFQRRNNIISIYDQLGGGATESTSLNNKQLLLLRLRVSRTTHIYFPLEQKSKNSHDGEDRR